MGCGTIAALALGATGTGLEMDASNSERNAANASTQQELNQQKNFARQGLGVFDKSLAQSTPQAMQNQLQQGQQQYLNAAKQAAIVPIGLPQNASNQVQNIAYQGQQARNSLAQGANANLQGYGNIGLQQGLKDLQANSQLGIIGTEAARNAQAFPWILQGDMQSRNNESAIGSLLGTAGSLVGLGGATGLFGGAAAPASTGGFASLSSPVMQNALGQFGTYGSWMPAANQLQSLGLLGSGGFGGMSDLGGMELGLTGLGL